MAKQNKKLAQVFHYELYGKRQAKYDFLNDNSLNSIGWGELENREPKYLFVKKDWNIVEKYNQGFVINELFTKGATGIKTQRDDANIFFSDIDRYNMYNDIIEHSEDDLKIKYSFKDVRDWKVSYAKDDLQKNKVLIKSLLYRPFDIRHTNYTGKTKGVMGYPRKDIMKHLVNDNFSFVTTRLNRGLSAGYCFISNTVLDLHLLDSAADSLQVFPLYLYPDQKTDGIFTEKDTSASSVPNRKPNLNLEIVEQIAKKIGLEFVPEKINNSSLTINNSFAPIDILDYIYAVLHSPTYREKYKEFLKIDFPRVPYPKDKETFWQLVKLGGELRQIHLLESPKVEEYITSYPIDGDNKITTKIGKKDWEITDREIQLGRIWINAEQYFENIPLVAWEFYIGGYQPAQKWLKDRKERTLNFDDILHYQKIIVALSETDRIMKEIDKIEIE